MNKNLKYFIMLMSVAVVLSMLVGSASADSIQTLGGPIGGNAPGNNGPGGLDLGGSGGGGLGSNVYLIIAVVAIIIVVAVLLIIKFVLPKLKQSK
jgi:p-aminobenzoyl-glutamate transporter AbgT